MDPIDKVTSIIENAVRQHFKLTSTEFDLAFSDMRREVAQVLDDAFDELLGDGSPAVFSLED
jgi:hypothetical protein